MSVDALDYLDDLYVTVTLELEPESQGLFKATLHWPRGNLYTQGHIDLSNIIDLDYYNNSSYWADSIHSVKPEQQALRLKTQQINGNALAKAIFVGNLFSFLDDLVAFAKDRIILLSVFYPSGLLDMIPWELLGDPENEFTKKFNLTISVSRGIFHKTPRVPRDHKQVKVVYITSQPLLYPGIHSELERIEKAIGTHRKFKLIPYPRTDITHTKFHRFIGETQPHILHLALHGEKGRLLFSKDDDDQPIPFRTLVREIHELRCVGLTIFNVCYSSAVQEDEIFLPGLPRQLVEVGMPCSIGMASKITDRAVFEFTEWLYMGLVEYKSVRRAYHAAIDELRNYNKSDRILWSMPMLFLNQDTVPLVDFLEKLLIEPDKPRIDEKFFQELFTVSGEFIRAYEKIHPGSRWDAIRWKNETRHLLLIFLRTQELVNRIEYKIPKTNHLPSRDLFGEISRIRRGVLRSLIQLGNNIPNWKELNYSEPSTARLLRNFMSKAGTISQGLTSLRAELRKLL